MEKPLTYEALEDSSLQSKPGLTMESERSPLGKSSVPRYTFLESGTPPKRNCSKSECCLCAAFIASLVVALVIILSYYLSPKYAGSTPPNISHGLDGLLQLQWPLREESYKELRGNLRDELKALEIGGEGLRQKESIEEILPSEVVDSPSSRHQIATYTTKQAQEMSRLGFVMNLASKEMNKCYENATKWNRKRPNRWVSNKPSEWYPWGKYCQKRRISCLISPYRTANGTCNNLLNPTWGASLQPFRRILLPNYEDGTSAPRRASDKKILPSAREVSLAIHRPVYKNDVNFTVMLAVWGQFIDHDITATAISRGKNGSAIKCCQTKDVHPECFPVLIGSSDPFYLQHNVTCMEFVRSAPAPACTLGPREQLNQVTSFLDGSVVYGNDDDISNLRTFSGGELKMLKNPAGDLLPISENLSDGCNRREEFERGRYCFLSGDRRSNENLLLTSMHLLFARQHNLIAKKLAEINSHWSDEKIFQETRKFISAMIQHITYNEFLPSVLPETLISHLNISTRRLGNPDLYNSSVNPTIANVFASAAFRFGHTLLPGLMQYLHNNSTREEYLALHKMLFNPFKLFDKGALESFMKGAMTTSSAKADVHFTQEVTEKLFQKEPKNPCGLDLVSLNIQRGRDHGLPSYPYWRTACGLKKPEDFNDLKHDIDEETLNKLKKLYKSIDDLDLYTGGLAEKPVMGGLVGPTITCILADQFLRLKVGDRFWYERTKGSQRFKPEQLKEIRKSSLAKLICLTSAVSEAQPYVMRRAGTGNELKSCDEFAYPEFEAWREK